MSVSSTLEYGEGYSAFENSKDRLTNPYRRGSAQWNRWNTGWLEAEDDLSGDVSDTTETSLTGNPILDTVIEESRDAS